MIYTRHQTLFLPPALVNRLKEWARGIDEGEVLLTIQQGRIVAWRLTECGPTRQEHGPLPLDRTVGNP